MSRPKSAVAAPPAHANVPLGECRHLFDESDVESIAAATGIRLRDGTNLHKAARDWSEGYWRAEFHGALREGYPAGGQAQREYFAGVLVAAEELLSRLGQEKEDWTFALLGSHAFVVQDDGASSVPAIAAEVLRLQESQPGQDEVRTDNRVWDAMPVADAAIRLLRQLAHEGLQRASRHPNSAGRPKDHFKPPLYGWLAGAFERAFGFPPETGSERSYVNCPSTIWINQVTDLAAKRVDERILLQIADADSRLQQVARHPVTLAVKAAAADGYITKANRLAKGWQEFTENQVNYVHPEFAPE